MTHDRSLAWTALLPADTHFIPLGAPDWLRERLEAASIRSGLPTLVSWDAGSADLPDLQPYDSVVLINSRQHLEQKLRPAGFEHIRCYAVTPGLSDARWLVPLGNRRVTAGAFRIYAPLKLSARLARLGAAAAARMGAGGWYRDRLLIATRGDLPIESLARGILPGNFRHLVLSSGTSGPERKPTAGLLDGSGNLVALAKLGISQVSSRLVEHEAAVLGRLGKREELDGQIPKLMFSGTAGGRRVTVQAALTGRPAPSRITTAHDDFLCRLRCGAPRPITESGLISSLSKNLSSLPDGESTAIEIFNGAMCSLANVVCPTTITHGDFAPWNLRHVPGQIRAFDWENAEIQGLPLVDSIHHDMQVGFLIEGWGIERALALLDRQAANRPSEMDPEQIRAIQIVYLLWMYVRRRGFGHADEEFETGRYLEMARAVAQAVGDEHRV